MSAPRTYWVYVLTNRSGTLRVGVTRDLERRMAEHAASGDETFTGRYALNRSIYAEPRAYVRDAIAREEQLEGWRRSKKVTLVNRANPGWRDLRAPPAPP